SLVKAGNGKRLGIYGFGAAAHIVAQVAKYQKREIYAFTRPGDSEAQEFALALGAVWAGSSNQLPPVKLDAAIIFAPVGELVPQALNAVRKGGTVVAGGIHMSDIRASLGRTVDLFGGQFNTAGRCRVHGTRAQSSSTDRSGNFCARKSQRSAGP